MLQFVGDEESILHTEFTRHDNPDVTSSTFGLSFTTQTSITWYLVPLQRFRTKRIGLSTTVQYPFMMLEPDEMNAVDLVPAKRCC